MNPYLENSLYLAAGFIAGIINAAAGGGSVLTIGLLLLLGTEPALANGTNRLGVLAGTVTSTMSLGQAKKEDWRKTALYGLFTLPGAVLGALVSIRISGRLFQLILTIVMIGVLATLIFPQKQGRVKTPLKHGPLLTAMAMVLIGFYGGFIQIGVGFLLMAALRYLLGLDLLTVTRYKVFIAMFLTLPATVVFSVTGTVHWLPALVLAAGQAIGCWIGGKLALKKGGKIIRIMLAIVIVLLAANQVYVLFFKG